MEYLLLCVQSAKCLNDVQSGLINLLLAFAYTYKHNYVIAM